MKKRLLQLLAAALAAVLCIPCVGAVRDEEADHTTIRVGLASTSSHNAMAPQIYKKAGVDNYVWMRPMMVENAEIPADKVDEIYLFQWNRDYPADVYFSLDLNSDYKKIKTEDFAGYSHEKITLEIYQKRS